MNVTPHLVIETVLRHARSDVWKSKEAMSAVLTLIGQAVLFDFGTLRPAPEHRDFALDLHDRGLFALPFPVVAFAMRGQPHATPHVDPSKNAGAMMVLSADKNDTFTAVMCSEMRSPDGRAEGAIPFATVMRARMENFRADDHAVDVTDTTYPLVNDRMMAAMFGSADEDGIMLMRSRMISNLIGCMGYTVMLMSKGVVTERTEAPAKLNAARAKKGKPRIGDRYVVRIDPGAARMIAEEGGGQTDITGHRRGSPRPHWRRGHFRTIYRGSATERVVPVAPALIAADPDSDVTKAVYRMRGSQR